MADFKVGDVVRLKSGGPKMTVERISFGSCAAPGSSAHCEWFAKDDIMHSASLTMETLCKVQAEEDMPRRAPKVGFMVGDVVQLLSGGPLMMVDEQLASPGDVHCMWFNEARVLTSAFFFPTQLRKVTPFDVAERTELAAAIGESMKHMKGGSS